MYRYALRQERIVLKYERAAFLIPCQGLRGFDSISLLTFQLLKFFLGERILGRIQHSLRLIEIQILYRYADVLEYFVQSLAEVSESNSTVVREVLLANRRFPETLSD